MTTTITMLPAVTAKVRPPRSLEVPWPLGFPLGRPRDSELQRLVIRAALALTDRTDVPFIAPFW